MNAIIKFSIISAIVIAVGVVINQVIQATLGVQINGAIVYFLESLAPINFIIPIAPVYLSIQIMGNFIYGVLLFIIIKWLAHFYTK